MDIYITHLDVSLDKAGEQKLRSEGFEKIDVNLNEGAGGNSIYLWYKKQKGAPRITRLQVTFNSEMTVGLEQAGYTKIGKNLNTGTPGDVMYLWYFRGSEGYDIPIARIDVTTNVESEAQNLHLGWERLACDLNRNAGGNRIYAWLKRNGTYICEVTATDNYGSDTDLFKDGYIRVDEDTNRGEGGSSVFIWYRQTTDEQSALTDLQISTNKKERDTCEKENYMLVSVNLNKETGGNEVYLWYKKEGVNHPIKAIALLFNQAAFEVYKKAGLSVIERNITTGWPGHTEYLCVSQ